jgi:signal transduction histidine kinase
MDSSKFQQLDAQNFAQNIVDTVREPLLILDGALRVRSANRAFYQTFQVSAQETEGQLIYELGNGQWDIRALRTLLEDIIPQESVFNGFELEHDFPSIGSKVMLLNARQLRRGEHEEFIVLAMEDVTERRRAERVLADVQAYAQNIVDTVREPLLMLDSNLRVKSANRAFYQTFHVSPAETENRLIYQLGNGQWDIPALRTLLEEIIPKHSVLDDYDLEHDFPDIGRRVILLNARRLRTLNYTEILVLAMEDVTERRRIHDLETRFTGELQESYARLQQLEKQRDDLTNMIVHDLRTPLSSVLGGMQILPTMGDLTEEQRAMVELSVRGGETLLGMINDLLDVEKMEAGAMELDYVTIKSADLVNSAADQVAWLTKSKQLSVEINVSQEAPPICADEKKLRRVLVNLLGNSIKFTPAHGCVIIAARPDADHNGVVFSVRDTGGGIPAGEFSRIFEKFGQVESRTGGGAMSTGLGLTFCKLAVEAHGGTIRVESEPGQGSYFSFNIPSFRPREVAAAGS